MTHVPKVDSILIRTTLWLGRESMIEKEQLSSVILGNCEIITSGKGTVILQVPTPGVTLCLALGKSHLSKP